MISYRNNRHLMNSFPWLAFLVILLALLAMVFI